MEHISKGNMYFILKLGVIMILTLVSNFDLENLFKMLRAM